MTCSGIYPVGILAFEDVPIADRLRRGITEAGVAKLESMGAGREFAKVLWIDREAVCRYRLQNDGRREVVRGNAAGIYRHESAGGRKPKPAAVGAPRCGLITAVELGAGKAVMMTVDGRSYAGGASVRDGIELPPVNGIEALVAGDPEATGAVVAEREDVLIEQAFRSGYLIELALAVPDEAFAPRPDP